MRLIVQIPLIILKQILKACFISFCSIEILQNGDSLVKVDWGEQSYTPLIEAVGILVGCNVQVYCEEDICACGIQVDWQSDLVSIGDFAAHPVECHHG